MAHVFDIETDGLLDTVSKIYLLTIEDTDTGELLEFSDYDESLPSLDAGLKYLSSCRILVGHNIIGYDLIVLKRLKGWVPGKHQIIYDTWIMSQTLRFKRDHLHGLEGWGKYLGFPKLEYNDWSKYSQEMRTYCRRDVGLNVKVYQHLVEEAKRTIAINPLFKEGLRIEMEFAIIESEIREKGWVFDMDAALKLLDTFNNEMARIEDIVNPRIGHICIKVDGADEPKQPSWRKDGCYNAVMCKYFGIDPTTGKDPETRLVDGPYSRVEFSQGDLGSDKVLKAYLYSIGWEPDEWNYEKVGREFIKKSPKLTDTSLEKLGEVGTLISKYNTIKNRRGILNGWIENAQEDGRLHGRMWTIGTPTFRCRHEVVANLPSVDADYGKEMRGLLICEPGKVIVGADSAGNQMRGLCHYIGNDEFTNEVINGDVHQKNADILSKVVDTPRKKAKPWLYAFLFGSGDGKLGLILTGSTNAKVGKATRGMFKSAIPGFSELVDKLEAQFTSTKERFGENKAFIRGLDGRIIFTESKHKVLNYLLQTCEGITCKAAIVYLKHKLLELGIPHYFSIHYHDELAVVVDKQYGDQVRALSIEAFTEAPKTFGVMCMGGDAHVGHSYAEVH